MNYSGSGEVFFALLTSITNAIKAENARGHAGNTVSLIKILAFQLNFFFSFCLSPARRFPGQSFRDVSLPSNVPGGLPPPLLVI